MPSIQEIPARRTIAGLPTAVAVFVGSAGAGPANVAQAVTSAQNFERHFGSISRGSAEASFLDR